MAKENLITSKSYRFIIITNCISMFPFCLMLNIHRSDVEREIDAKRTAMERKIIKRDSTKFMIIFRLIQLRNAKWNQHRIDW